MNDRTTFTHTWQCYILHRPSMGSRILPNHACSATLSTHSSRRLVLWNHKFSWHNTSSFNSPHIKHPLTESTTLWMIKQLWTPPNDTWYTTTCQHISADCVTHGDETLSNHLCWGHNPVISSVLLDVSHGTHDKQHVGILLCLLSSTWIHSKSSFLIELYGPVWMWWSSNPSWHCFLLCCPGMKLKWGRDKWLSSKIFNVNTNSHTYLYQRKYDIC